jgi:putative SOS response-associated peptidase YedK
MCYDIKTSLEKQLRRALMDGHKDLVSEINKKLSIFSDSEINLYHASGFDHPKMFIYTSDSPKLPIVATWGLVPTWSNDKEAIWDKTLNARGETIFEKPAFKESASSKRCIIFLEGFYEHHHKSGSSIPYFIKLKDKEIFAVAGLWSEWLDNKGEILRTFTIVTTTGNTLMAKIHNNPKLPEPRMPLILDEVMQEKWLNNKLNMLEVIALIQPLPSEELIAHPVGPIKGKNAIGNKPNVTEELKYALLESGEQLQMF